MASRIINELTEPRVILEDIPITALRHKSRSKLSTLLNPEKVLVSEDGYSRDWRGIFTLSGLTQSEFALISQSEDKMEKLLDIWNRKNLDDGTHVTLSQLQHCFGIIDRYDVCDDTMNLFAEDAIAFRRQEVQPIVQMLPVEPVNSNLLTVLDQEHYNKGLPLPIYDALVIYSDQQKDIDFAAELVDRLTEKGHLLCVKDRDLLPGLSFETDSLLTLLSKRCNRVIILISKAFLESKMHLFITNYAQSFGITNGQRKIIPCVIEPEIELPQMLKFSFFLDYQRSNRFGNFWEKLDQSLKMTMEQKNPAIEQSPSRQQEEVINFSQPPTTPEKIRRFHSSTEAEPQRQIMPPARRLRQSSSMASLDKNSNGSIQNISQSTLNLTQDDKVDGGKLKRKPWYSKFLPPKKEKVKEEGNENEPIKEKKEKKLRLKLKKSKKEKIAA